MEEIRISCKNLGELALRAYCPRCFWLKLHADKLPFQMFPGIFSSIDSYSKKITSSHFEKHGRPPAWFDALGSIGAPVHVPHHSKFYIIDEKRAVRLTGVPDEIFRAANNSHYIIDYKTARYTAAQDSLMPIYEVQLNGYAYIAERTGFAPVSGIALLYYEPLTDISHIDVDSHTHDGSFDMHFTPHLHPLTLDTGIIEPLLEKLREIYDLEKAPRGVEWCKNCHAMGDLVKLLAD